ncbi:unnamed protein product, partial [Closterium sp. Naga37s-1]
MYGGRRAAQQGESSPHLASLSLCPPPPRLPLFSPPAPLLPASPPPAFTCRRACLADAVAHHGLARASTVTDEARTEGERESGGAGRAVRE